MPADIVNLNKVRKARERAEKEKRAEENRLKFGRSKAERTGIDADTARSEALLDGARRETPQASERGNEDDKPDNVS